MKRRNNVRGEGMERDTENQSSGVKTRRKTKRQKRRSADPKRWKDIKEVKT